MSASKSSSVNIEWSPTPGWPLSAELNLMIVESFSQIPEMSEIHQNSLLVRSMDALKGSITSFKSLSAATLDLKRRVDDEISNRKIASITNFHRFFRVPYNYRVTPEAITDHDWTSFKASTDDQTEWLHYAWNNDVSTLPEELTNLTGEEASEAAKLSLDLQLLRDLDITPDLLPTLLPKLKGIIITPTSKPIRPTLTAEEQAQFQEIPETSRLVFGDDSRECALRLRQGIASLTFKIPGVQLCMRGDEYYLDDCTLPDTCQSCFHTISKAPQQSLRHKYFKPIRSDDPADKRVRTWYLGIHKGDDSTIEEDIRHAAKGVFNTVMGSIIEIPPQAVNNAIVITDLNGSCLTESERLKFRESLQRNHEMREARLGRDDQEVGFNGRVHLVLDQEDDFRKLNHSFGHTVEP